MLSHGKETKLFSSCSAVLSKLLCNTNICVTLFNFMILLKLNLTNYGMFLHQTKFSVRTVVFSLAFTSFRKKGFISFSPEHHHWPIYNFSNKHTLANKHPCPGTWVPPPPPPQHTHFLTLGTGGRGWASLCWREPLNSQNPDQANQSSWSGYSLVQAHGKIS